MPLIFEMAKNNNINFFNNIKMDFDESSFQQNNFSILKKDKEEHINNFKEVGIQNVILNNKKNLKRKLRYI